MTQRRRVKTFQATEGSSWVRFGWNLYQLLPDIWNFVWVLKGLLLNWPKYLTWPNMSKNAKNCFIALATWILRVRRIKLFHWVYLLFWPNFGEVWLKKTLKIEIKLFIDLHFQLPNNFCFSDYVTNTLISVQLWAGPFSCFVIFLGRERALIPSNRHTLQPPFIGSISY